MKHALKFSARQENGNLIIQDAYRFKKYMAMFGTKQIDVIVKEHHEDRTNPQERYYRGVIVRMISEKTGQPVPDVHKALKRMFLTKTIELIPGQPVEVVGSTRDLDTVEMNDFMRQCREWAWDFLEHFVIPEPEKVEVNG